MARRNSTSGSSEAGSGRLSTCTEVVTLVLPSGMRVVPPTELTPGSASSRWNHSA
jgi:hypothetical protein